MVLREQKGGVTRYQPGRAAGAPPARRQAGGKPNKPPNSPTSQNRDEEIWGSMQTNCLEYIP